MHPRILICDDRIYSRAMLKSLIDQCGQFIILEAENGQETLDIIQKQNEKKRKIDLLFLDIESKKKEGLEVLKSLRDREPSLEVIVCGGLSLTDENIVKMMHLNVNKFLSKPYKYKDIATLFENIGGGGYFEK